MKHVLLAAMLALTAAAAIAQTSASIEVRVVNVDVVVRDRAGKPVTGLTKADFEVYEDGQRREVTNLAEMKAERAPSGAAAKTPDSAPPPEEPRPRAARNVVLFIDNYTIEPYRRGKMLDSLRRFVDERLQPADRVMLVLCTQQARVITPLTTDRDQLAAGIETVRQSGTVGFNQSASLQRFKQQVSEYIESGKAGKLPWVDYYGLAMSAADAYVEEVIFNARNTLTSLTAVTTTMSGMEGKNVVVFAGGYLPEKPGAEVYRYVYNAFVPYMPGLSMNTESLFGKSGSLQQYKIADTAKAASASGVTLYTVDAADTRDITSAENAIHTDQEEQFMTFTNTAAAYDTLARMTGGIAVTNTANFDVAFRTLADDLDSYYSLGFRPGGGAGGGQRAITVKVKNPAYSVRTRGTYASRTPEDEIGARTVSNLYAPDPHNDWHVAIDAGAAEPKGGGRFEVPLEITFDPEVTLLPDKSGLAGKFSVYVVVGQGQDRSDTIRRTQPVTIPAATEDEFRTQPITYRITIATTAGEKEISVAVVDETTKTASFARTRVTVP